MSTLEMVTCVVFEDLSLGGHHDNASGLPDILRASVDPREPTIHEFERGVATPLIARGRAIELEAKMDFDKAAARLLAKAHHEWATAKEVKGTLQTLVKTHAKSKKPPKPLSGATTDSDTGVDDRPSSVVKAEPEVKVPTK